MGIKPDGKFRDELREELEQKDREILKEREKKKNASKISSNRIKALEERREEILDLLDGRESVQPALPLTTPKAGKKPEPPPIEWRIEKGGQTGYVLGVATYRVELGLGGKYDVAHGIPGTKPKNIGSEPTETAAKDLAQKDHLKRCADGILANAGDGKLTKGRGRGKAGAGAAP